MVVAVEIVVVEGFLLHTFSPTPIRIYLKKGSDAICYFYRELFLGPGSTRSPPVGTLFISGKATEILLKFL